MTSQTIFQSHLRSFIFRKYLDIITIISIIAFCCLILSTKYLKSYSGPESLPNASQLMVKEFADKTQLTEQQTKIKPVVKLQLKTTESSLKSKLKTILNCLDLPLREEKSQYGEYWLIKNHIRGSKSINMGCGESITYTTNGDYTFMDNLPTVVERWLAPISFALFTPGDDYDATMNSIQYVRNCLPESQLIREYVTFHIFFPTDHLPSFVAKNEEEAIEWTYDCELQDAPYVNVNRSEMYKTLKNLTYPINVARNIARKAANTYFIFACDIELYPSLNLVKEFLEMVIRNPAAVLEGISPKVFVLPVFEVKKKTTLPNNKGELTTMLHKKLAIPFHMYVCLNCHLVPKQKHWIEANSSQELEVFTVAKRYDKFSSWEPFYISDNKEPIFDERVTWEGQSNKRIQNYAMCLMDYEYHILHPAFLVHAPGIKKLNLTSNETKVRFKYAAAMNKIISRKIIPEYSVLYGKNTKCGV